jgi:uncharacterized protein YqhQ
VLEKEIYVKTYGGQAVIEGVMMRGRRHVAVAVRAPSGDIILHEEPLTGGVYQSKVAKLPLIRGAVAIWDTMVLGVRTLVFSANVAMRDEKDEVDGKQTEMPQGVLWGTLAFSLFMACGLFFVLPVLLVSFLDQYYASSVLSNFVEKVIRLGLVLGYMVVIGRMPEIQRVFAYHGAEHKAINAYEAGLKLTPENVQRCSLIHPRCGTTFMIVVVFISFLLFTLLGQPPMAERILSRILLVPIVAGIAYELIRFMAVRYQNSAFVRLVMAPGLAVQRLTTREPDLAMCAVAIAALEPVIAVEEGKVAEPATSIAAASLVPAGHAGEALPAFGKLTMPVTNAPTD